jgi:hypothetical protein
MHFALLVIGDDVDEKMAPYEEYTENSHFKWYVDAEDGTIKTHPTDPDARAFIMVRHEDAKPLKVETDENGHKFIWHCLNPLGRWDWYTIGGRWRGMLKLKSGKVGVCGAGLLSPGEEALRKMAHEAGFETSVDEMSPAVAPGYTDQARFCDIDWESMKNDPERIERFGNQWDLFQVPRDERPFSERELVERFSTHGLMPPEYFITKYGDRENFIVIQTTFWTAHLITEDGEWHEVAPVWLEPASPEACREWREWALGYWDRFLKDLSPDTLLTIVDCHI